MPLDFTAIDFETANSSNASACAVGLVRVRGGEVVDKTGWLIRPPAGHDAFFELNTRIHGIRAEVVIGAEAGFADFPHHNATADALACAHVMIDAARRMGADDIDGLAELVGVRVSQIEVAAAPAVSFAVA